MEFKKTLDDYTREEFKCLVAIIWNADMDKGSQARLIEHFDQIVGHPFGADLLFYPPDLETGNEHSIESVLSHVQQWHNTQGKAAFKDEPVPVTSAKPPVRLSPQERKVETSRKSLEKVNQLIVDIDSAVQSANEALTHFTRLLDQWRAKPLDARSIAGHMQEMTTLEMAQSATVRAITSLATLKLKVQFAKSDAERNLGSSFRDPAIQASVLEIIQRGSAHYLSSLEDIDQRHQKTHTDCMPLLKAAEEHLVIRLSAPGASIDKTPSVMHVAARDAQLRPCVMFAAERTVMDVQHFNPMKRAIRSVVAEYAWQASSLDEKHPDTFSGVASFIFDHWKARDRYAVSVPLEDLMPIDGLDWQMLANEAGEVELPYRLSTRSAPMTAGKLAIGLTQITALEQICLTPTVGERIPAKVKVRRVETTPAGDAFLYTKADQAPLVIRWSRSSDISLKPAPVKRSVASYVSIPQTPLLESFESSETLRFDDVVLVFPAGSGLQPLYLMFKGDRTLAA